MCRQVGKGHGAWGQTNSTTFQLTVVLSILPKLLYAHIKYSHLNLPLLHLLNFQQLFYSPSPNPHPGLWARFRGKKKSKDEQWQSASVLLRGMFSLDIHGRNVTLNLGCMSESAGSSKTSRSPSCSPNWLNQDFEDMGLDINFFVLSPCYSRLCLTISLPWSLMHRKIIKRNKKEPCHFYWLNCVILGIHLFPDCQIKILTQLCSFYYMEKMEPSFYFNLFNC